MKGFRPAPSGTFRTKANAMASNRAMALFFLLFPRLKKFLPASSEEGTVACSCPKALFHPEGREEEVGSAEISRLESEEHGILSEGGNPGDARRNALPDPEGSYPEG